MSLLRTPTKLTDRVENESDVERREKQPTRDEKGGAMLWRSCPELLRSCPKRVLFFFFRRELPYKNGATFIRLFSLDGGESEATQLFVSLPNNLPYPGRCKLAQKLRNAEIRDSIVVTCKRSTKSLEHTSIRKVYEQRNPLVSFWSFFLFYR